MGSDWHSKWITKVSNFEWTNVNNPHAPNFTKASEGRKVPAANSAVRTSIQDSTEARELLVIRRDPATGRAARTTLAGEYRPIAEIRKTSLEIGRRARGGQR